MNRSNALQFATATTDTVSPHEGLTLSEFTVNIEQPLKVLGETIVLSQRTVVASTPEEAEHLATQMVQSFTVRVVRERRLR